MSKQELKLLEMISSEKKSGAFSQKCKSIRNFNTLNIEGESPTKHKLEQKLGTLKFQSFMDFEKIYEN